MLNSGSFKSMNCRETVKDFVASDQEFHFMNIVKRIPAYWDKFKSKVLVNCEMIRYYNIILPYIILSRS